MRTIVEPIILSALSYRFIEFKYQIVYMQHEWKKKLRKRNNSNVLLKGIPDYLINDYTLDTLQ